MRGTPEHATAVATPAAARPYELPREFLVAAGSPCRELPPEAVQLLLAELRVTRTQRVLLLNPASALLPAAFAAAARQVEACFDDAAAAAAVAAALANHGIQGVTTSQRRSAGPAPSQHLHDIVVDLSPGAAASDASRALLAPRGTLVRPAPGDPGTLRLLLEEPADGDARRTRALDLVRFTTPLVELLMDSGALTIAAAAAVGEAARQHRRSQFDELRHSREVRDEDLYRALARQQRTPFATTREALALLDSELCGKLPRRFLDHYAFVPLRVERGTLHVLTTNAELPAHELCDAFEARTLAPRLCTPTDLQRVWSAVELGLVHSAVTPAATPAPAPTTAPAAPAADSRTGNLLDVLLVDAAAERASDIHLEVYGDRPRIRLRVDGGLQDIDGFTLSASDYVALVNTIKVAARLDIAEKRLPQGGRLHHSSRLRNFDLRVQTQPALHGEHIVLRILPQQQQPPSIDELGMNPGTVAAWRRLLLEPQGMVLVVGPTGSGKSTTLCAGLAELARDSTRKVLTIEDPIEFAIAGVQQAQVNLAAGFHFADAVRSFVRQDPDVIMVGEVRDRETALEAVRASQTGHLLLSTMHCNDAVDSMQRLLDLDVHHNSVAGELTAVISQRLARRICNACRVPAEPDPALLAELFGERAPRGFRCFRGTGCPRCRGAGTSGRIAVVEYLRMTPALRAAVSRRVGRDELLAVALTGGMRAMREEALDLIQQGVLPMTELYDLLSLEQISRA